MTTFEFEELCNATCLVLGLEDTSKLMEEGEIMIDGVRIGAFLDEEQDDIIHFYTDLGPVEPDDRLTVFERALGLNLELDGDHGESLGFDSRGGHLYLRAAINVFENCDSKQMAQWFNDYVAFAKEFHDSAGGAESMMKQSGFPMSLLA